MIDKKPIVTSSLGSDFEGEKVRGGSCKATYEGGIPLSEGPYFTLQELRSMHRPLAQKIVQLMVRCREFEEGIIHNHGNVPRSFKEKFGFDPKEID